LTRRSGDLPKEGDERLLANQHAVLKPRNLPNALDAGRMDAPDAGRTDAIWSVTGVSTVNRMQLMAIDILDVPKAPDAGWMDALDAGRTDATPSVTSVSTVNGMQLMANDILDVLKAPDAGRMDAPDTGWADAPDAGWMDAADTGRMDAHDAGRMDATRSVTGVSTVSTVNGMQLMANDIPDVLDAPHAEQLDAGRIPTLLVEAYQTDPFPEQILGLLRNGARQCKEISLADCKERDSRLVC